MKPQQLFARTQDFLPKDRKNQKIFLVGAGSILFASALVGLAWQNLPPEIPVLYSQPWGEEQLGQPLQLFLPLGLATAFFVVNLAFAANTDNSFLKRSLFLGSTTASILASITVVRILFLML